MINGTTMDYISTAFHVRNFQNAFVLKKGTAFQEWFVQLAGFAWGSDFEAVRPYGRQGDWKCDGRRLSTGTIFQCYAPDSISDQQIIDKIKTDLVGAVEKWPDFIRGWVLVHNDNRGLPPTVAAHLDTQRKNFPELKIETWAEPKLFELFSELSDQAKLALFGPVPTQHTMYSLQDLEPVITAMKVREPPEGGDLPPPPSVEKLDKNDLSQEARDLLRFGRRRVRLVEDYFVKNVKVELGERIAEAFRNRYAELRDLDLSSDRIFQYLCQFAGVSGEPVRQSAAMAVLMYFFDRCDIFEDSKEGEEAES